MVDPLTAHIVIPEHPPEPGGSTKSKFDSEFAEGLGAITQAIVEGKPLTEIVEDILVRISATFRVSEMVLQVIDSDLGQVFSCATYGFPEDRARAIIEKVSNGRRTEMPSNPIPADRFRVSRNGYYVPVEERMKQGGVESPLEGIWSVRHPGGASDPRTGPDQWHPLDFYRFAVKGGDSEPLAALDICYSFDHKLLSKEEVTAISLFADLAGLALQRERMRQAGRIDTPAMAQKTLLLEDVLNIASSIVSERDLTKLSDMILASVSSLFGFNKVSLVIYDESESAFKWIDLFGYPEDTARDTRFRQIPTDSVMEDLHESRRIGRSAYFTPIEEVSPRQFAHYVQPRHPDSAKPELPRAKGVWRAGDCLGFVLHDSTGRIVGVIYPSEPKDGRIPDKDTIGTVEIFTSLAEIAIENARLSTEREQALRLTSQRTEQLSRILDLASSIMYVRNLDQMLDELLKTLARLMGIKRMVIGIRHDEEGVYKIEAVYGYSHRAAEAIREFHYSVAQIDSVIDSGPFPSNPSIKWRRKVGRMSYYFPVEGQVVSVARGEMPYYPEPDLIRLPRAGKDHWHEMDWIDTMILDKTGAPMAYLEILKPRDDRVPDSDTIEIIEIFASLAGIAIENAKMFQEHIDSRRDSELYTDVLSHDIKNFNQAILGYLDLLRLKVDKPESLSLIDKIAEQAMNTSWLASNVRTMSRVTFGEIELVRTDLGAVLSQCEKSLTQYYPSRKIVFGGSADQGSFFVLADDLIWELFTNIFTNAVKYDPHEPLELKVSVERTYRVNRKYWTVSIADRGRGIPDEVKEVIFDRFTKAPKKKGEGMGLHIVKTLAGRYNGRVWVEDKVKGDYGKGAVFKVELPALD